MDAYSRSEPLSCVGPFRESGLTAQRSLARSLNSPGGWSPLGDGSSRLLLCALGSLAIGMALDVIVIVRNLSESPAVAVVTGATAGIGFLVAWYVVLLWARRRDRPRQGENYARAA